MPLWRNLKNKFNVLILPSLWCPICPRFLINGHPTLVVAQHTLVLCGNIYLSGICQRLVVKNKHQKYMLQWDQTRSMLKIRTPSYVHHTIGRDYAIAWRKRENINHFDMLQLLHLNSDLDTWKNNFHDSQLLTILDDSRSNPTAWSICGVASGLHILA